MKLNFDENAETPIKYGVQGVPTLLLFDNGNVVSTCVGARPKNRIVTWIDEHI